MSNPIIPTATFVLSDGGLIQSTSADSILSETIIGTSDHLSANNTTNMLHTTQPDIGQAEMISASAIFSESETIIDSCAPVLMTHNPDHPSITIESVHTDKFLTPQHNSNQQYQYGSCSVLQNDMPTFTIKTGSTVVEHSDSFLSQPNEHDGTFAAKIQYLPLQTTTRSVGKLIPVSSDSSANNNSVPFTLMRVNKSNGQSAKKATFKLIRGASDTASKSISSNLQSAVDNSPQSNIYSKHTIAGTNHVISSPEGITINIGDTMTQIHSDVQSPSPKKIVLASSNKSTSKANTANAQLPPPGSTSKIARNATLIDLSKVQKDRDRSKPLLIDKVTVMIDQSDNVKVLDYGSTSPNLNSVKSNFYSPQKRSQNSCNSSSKRPVRTSKNNKRCHSTLHQYNSGDYTADNNSSKKKKGDFLQTDDGNLSSVDHSEFDDVNSEPAHDQFEDPNMSISLEHMRQLRVDCNVALVDPAKEHVVYAHRTVLVARSPYFYKNLYVRRKKLHLLHHFCRFTLPHQLDFAAVDAVVGYMYAGSISPLYGCSAGASSVLKVLQQFEMTDAAELFSANMPPEAITEPATRRSKEIKVEPMEHDSNHLLLPFFNSPVEEVTIDERRKRRKLSVSDHDKGSSEDATSNNNNYSTSNGFMVNYSGDEIRMKASVQKLVDTALTPFLSKLEELFDPNSTTMHVARTSQHVITLWNADLLLTKLFDQNELTKYFTDHMNDIMEVGSYDTENVATNVGSYVVETLANVTGLDDVYTMVGSNDSAVPEVETLTVGDMQIINYTQMDYKHIPKYVRLISLYRFRIVVGPETETRLKSRQNLLALEGSDSTDAHFLEGLGDPSLPESLNPLDLKAEQLTRLCIKQVSQDLSRRTIGDLDARVNMNYQEEMIMHIVVEQMEVDKILPLCIGIFLAKGCTFCRKRECKAEDLVSPIGPDNPVCPDRQCIKRNLVCHLCNKQMANSKSLARHKYSVHDVQNTESAGLYICSHCGETFSKKWKLNVHEKQHEDRKLHVTCHICNKNMRGAIALKKHINMVHETKRQYTCDHCNKMFKRKETLLVHRRIHTGEKPFVCSHCDYSSETKGNLKAHTWRKHKRPLLATSVANNGVETSITGPIATMEEMMETDGIVCSDGIVDGVTDGTTASDGVVMDTLEETTVPSAADEQAMAASLVHAHLQDATFMMQ